MSVKHTVEDEDAVERTHPTFFPLLEQWEQHAQAIQRLRVGEAFVRLPNDSVRRVKTPTLPAVSVSPQHLAAVQEYYLQHYFRAVSQLAPTSQRRIITIPEVVASGLPPIHRYHPDEQTAEISSSLASNDTTGDAVFDRKDRNGSRN